MEGGSAVFLGQLLIVVTASPDSGSIIRRVSHEPDIVIIGGSTALSGCRHAGDGGGAAGRINACAGPCIHDITLHYIGHCVSQKEGSGLL